MVPFQIYKVDTIRKDTSNDTGQFYKIFFCSPEMYYNHISSVSKAYRSPIENGVKIYLEIVIILIQKEIIC